VYVPLDYMRILKRVFKYSYSSSPSFFKAPHKAPHIFLGLNNIIMYKISIEYINKSKNGELGELGELKMEIEKYLKI